ncbi:hypothetical protein DL766_006947 [Monosporascus sp. MC13-8B]|uniref:DNA/RNA-binding domain-containing protein n=1 Tax=Monosporascus cannonballus TaxID=155416 RepID=A0ABY0GXK1_9PEZI|nr:hypothetical protein DL762_008283 [Monosporascus cannonballus]RYO84142.1 hypothetical protein DL763_007571 [Monosporascus cannonballus]RYP25679.1 hypothetical protein DL766_006947 [Monosporascus sp. MC13-8B]
MPQEISIPTCGEESGNTDDRFKPHLQSPYPDMLVEKDVTTLTQQMRESALAMSSPRNSSTRPNCSETAPSVAAKLDQDGSPPRDTSGLSPNNGRISPGPRPRSSSPLRLSQARQDFRRSLQVGKPWNPEDADGDAVKLIKQPQTRPINNDQLEAEVKGIYSGIVLLESKCIEVDEAQSSRNDAKLNNEQWQALTQLHRALLHEHHDFFLASQHPSASPALRRLASKYSMPARMWRHGIHSFLELLRHRLPASLEHMLTFIYLAYSMMALLYETVPAFEDTWIECLGDLGRYRMAIEDDDIHEREAWNAVSRSWYSKASDKAPTVGRLYHHLAILARPNALRQLFYYVKSLCVPIPFGSARQSIMTLFDPILKATQPSRLATIDAAFVKAHGILFSGSLSEQFIPAMEEFLGKLDSHIDRTTRRWVESGYYIGISNCCALLSYGEVDNGIMRAINPRKPEEPSEMAVTATAASEGDAEKSFASAARLSRGTCNIVFRRTTDPNVLPFMHVTMTFIYHLARFPDAIALIEDDFPWELSCAMLNSLLLSYREYGRILSDKFPRQHEEPAPRPLPEDFAMKGLPWVEGYFPNDWFSNEKIDYDEKYFEAESMTGDRKERILWLGCRIAEHGKWLLYDEELHRFGVVLKY